MEDFDKFLDYQQRIAESTLQIIKDYRTKNRNKRTYSLITVENILKSEERPLHISEIIDIAKRDFNLTLNRDSLSSSLSKKVNQGQIFVRTAPNTFFLNNE